MKIETIQVGELKTNCYLIIVNDKCIIVDPGSDFEIIKNKIKQLKLTPIAIFITHYHFDHIGSLNECIKEYNIKVFDYQSYIDDKTEFQIDDLKFYIIAFPGHKNDLVAFYFKDYKIMFIGDFVFKNDIGRCDLAYGNFTEMLNSIKKLKQYPVDITLYPGHGEITYLKDEIKNNQYFKN